MRNKTCLRKLNKEIYIYKRIRIMATKFLSGFQSEFKVQRTNTYSSISYPIKRKHT